MEEKLLKFKEWKEVPLDILEGRKEWEEELPASHLPLVKAELKYPSKESESRGEIRIASQLHSWTRSI
ncbi:hypothetical protein, partial [Staphylococcus aureus]|uniref:hypothetical protein n=1 Tax=Staphylococcus aureus TaxID=1280 RepID=UPI0039BDA57B